MQDISSGKWTEVTEWLDGKYNVGLKCSSGKQAARYFSDAVQLAEILKQLYPNLVTMHSYQQKNSVKSKYSNWCVLNKKVLSKINLALTEKEMLRLSNTEPGAIEDVLFRIMTIDNSDGGIINSKQASALPALPLLDNADQNSISETTASVVSEETILDDISFVDDDDDAVQCIGDQPTFKQMDHQNKLISELQLKVQIADAIFELKSRLSKLMEGLDRCDTKS